MVGAKLTPRRYRDPVRPNVALSQVFMNRGKTIDMQYAALLVKELAFTRSWPHPQLAMWPWSPTARQCQHPQGDEHRQRPGHALC